MRRFNVLRQGSNLTLDRTLMVWLLLVSLAFAGCGGQLGKIEPPVVDTAIAEAEAAIAAARDVDAASLAPDAFRAANANLEAAREALAEKRGVDALRLAHQASADAKLAHRHAINVAKSAELNAAILQKESNVIEFRQRLKTLEERFSEKESEFQKASRASEQLRQRIQELQVENSELGDTRKAFGKQISDLSKTLEDTQVRARRAEEEIRNYGSELSKLRRKLEVADKIAKEEGYQKRAAVAEAESLRKQMREQAEVYTKKLADAGQQDIAAKHAESMVKREAEARAYEASQPALSPPKTGRTSLSTQQIAAGKAALNNWERAWHSKNLDAHLAYYDRNIVADKVVVFESKENRSKIDRQQLESDLRQMRAHTWRKVKFDTEVESESVIGILQLSQLVHPAADENDTSLHDVWIREIWMHQVGNSWKIHHEIWKVFERVPDL